MERPYVAGALNQPNTTGTQQQPGVPSETNTSVSSNAAASAGPPESSGAIRKVKNPVR